MLPNKSLKAARFLMPPYPVTNFETQKYYQNESSTKKAQQTSFSAWFTADSRNSMPKIMYGENVMNLDKNKPLDLIG